MMRFLTGMVLMLALQVPAVAEDQPDCENGSQSELNMCAYLDFEKADDELNKLWPKVKKFAVESDASYDKNQQGALKALMDSQRAWLVYRDGHCVLHAFQSHGGSMEPMLDSGCRAGLTKKRVKELQETISETN